MFILLLPILPCYFSLSAWLCVNCFYFIYVEYQVKRRSKLSLFCCVFTLFSHHMYDDVIKGLLNGGQKYRATTTRKAQKIMMVERGWCNRLVQASDSNKLLSKSSTHIPFHSLTTFSLKPNSSNTKVIT